MIACFDVQYDQDRATAAAITFSDWTDTTVAAKYQKTLKSVAEYQPGSFYLRELGPLTEIIETIPTPVQYYVIDAYCHLSASQEPGLGARLAKLLPSGSIVIGVAKNRFRDTDHAVELYRGNSNRPLFVTSIGIDYHPAASLIQSMAGPNRIPQLLKEVDQLSRQIR